MAAAYKLLGLICENQKQLSSALDAFKQALALDPAQSDIVLKGLI